MGRVRTVIVDDNRYFRDALKAALPHCADIDLLGEAPSAREALALVGRTRPDLVLLDISLPGGSGLDIIRDLRRLSPHTRILLLTIFEDGESIARAIGEGADGFCFKSEGRRELRRAIRAVLRGERYVSAIRAPSTGVGAAHPRRPRGEPTGR